MEKFTHHSLINGKRVRGIGHLQPGPNPWIGIFVVPDNLLEGNPTLWKSMTVQYSGLFDCRSEDIPGCGEAKITYIGPAKEDGYLIIHAEGMGKPELEKELKEKIHFSYNSNLFIDEKALRKRKPVKK